MKRSLPLVVVVVAACAAHRPSTDAGVDAGPTFVSVGHSHNDYEHPRPLFDALALGYASVEADVVLDGGLLVTHDGVSIRGTLRSLYLEPLQAMVSSAGAVLPDGGAFTLWVDLKQGSPALQDALAAELTAFAPMLTRFDDAHVTEGAVTVVLTGNGSAKRALVDRPPPRFWCRDDGQVQSQDPPADTKWRYYAVDWLRTVGWTGTGTIPEADLVKVKGALERAHAKGRKLRYYGSPDTPEYWRLMRELGLDFIGTDDLPGLAAVLAEP